VNIFAGEADIGDAWNLLLVWKNVGALTLLSDFATFLRRVVFIGETAYCSRPKRLAAARPVRA
jgi:hypothetical protein